MSEFVEIIAFVTQKGGAGKTTLLSNLAVAASIQGKKIMLLDADPQKTLSAWWEDREAHDIDCTIVNAEDIGLLATVAEKFSDYDYIFIDTPAQAEAVNRAAIAAADFCLVPCRPSLPDMRAQRVTAQVIQNVSKPAAFVVTQAPSQGTRVLETQQSLAVYSLPVAKFAVTQLVAYQDAYALGLGVMEYDPQGKAADETLSLWKWVQTKMEKLTA